MARPAYLAKAGTPQSVADLAQHQKIGFSHPESLNVWPVLQPDGDFMRIKPTISASSGETIRQLALAGQGIARISDFFSREDCATGRLVPVLSAETRDLRLPVHAVYYRNTTLSSRIGCFLDFLRSEIDRRQLL